MLRTGDFVTVKGTKEGQGKCVDLTPDSILIEWFLSAARQVRNWYPASLVQSAAPARQTRCYWKNPETSCWENGRLYAVRDDVTYIKFPEGDRANRPTSEVFVRCHTGRVDPLELMRASVLETPYFHTQRAPLVQALIEDQAATHGLSALLSARIQLYDHQVDVVRRVLEDPIQRYLLADEVGLGKTIEAGVIVRQSLLDSDDSRVLILTPPTLIAQWRNELKSKLDLGAFWNRITFVTTDVLTGRESNQDAGLEKLSPFDLVVIDEAHHVARLAYAQGLTTTWAEIQALCHSSRGLLLLSATPALHHEADFLAMLHLLEPQSYRLEEVEAFRAKVQGREGIATVLDLLQEGMSSGFVIRAAVRALREHLGSDPFVVENADALEQYALLLRQSPEKGNQATLNEMVRQVRLHICETYRVHRRMLRSSRRRVPSDLMPARSLGRLNIEFASDPRFEKIQDHLDYWRTAAIEADATDTPYLEVFHLLLSMAFGSPNALAEALRYRQKQKVYPAILEPSWQILITVPLFEGEAALLSVWRDLLLDPDDGSDILADYIEVFEGCRGGRTVIFTDSAELIESLAQRLATDFKTHSVYRYLRTMTSEQRQSQLDRFSHSASGFFLCDASGEEGLNLQFADRLFFLDLPWDVNRLEQRIGRLDRIGRQSSQPAALRIFLPGCDNTTFADAFFKLVRDGVGLFQESAADLQFFLDREIKQWVRQAFLYGAEALSTKTAAVKEQIIEERRLLRQQNALDELDAYGEDALSFATTLKEAQTAERERQFQKALNGWLVAALQFDRQQDPPRYRHTLDTLLPEDRWRPIAACLEPGQGITFSRQDVTTLSGAALMRTGHPFVDALIRYMQWEDRGQAWAFWRLLRHDECPKIQERAYFRFDLLIDVDPEPLEAAFSDQKSLWSRPLVRQASGWFPPAYQSIFVEASTGRIVTDLDVFAVLTLPYDSHQSNRDKNLSRAECRPLLAEVVPDMLSALTAAAGVAATYVLRQDSLKRCQATARRAVEKTLDRRLNQLRRGLVFADQSKETETTERMYRALADGIANPRVRFDAVGLLILSRRFPFGTDTLS